MHSVNESHKSPIFVEDAFSRQDEEADSIFYSRSRLVSHLDAVALATVESLIRTLVIQEDSLILDLMAGWDSHIPEGLEHARVVGLGLNEEELKENNRLAEYVIHDLNMDPRIPFPDEAFDVVMNTVSVDYMTKPIDVFREVGRILKPGGLFLVVFSNRMFPPKAVKVWRESNEDERVLLVEEFFSEAGLFNKSSIFVSKGRARPKEDKYARLDLPSDPVYAVYAQKGGSGEKVKKRPSPSPEDGKMVDQAELERRKKLIKKTLRCPHCEHPMRKWAVPDNPFSQTWDNDFMYICFNDECSYYIRGWNHMYKAGNCGISYRLMYNPENDCCSPVPVPSPKALKEGIMDD